MLVCIQKDAHSLSPLSQIYVVVGHPDLLPYLGGFKKLSSEFLSQFANLNFISDFGLFRREKDVRSYVITSSVQRKRKKALA